MFLKRIEDRQRTGSVWQGVEVLYKTLVVILNTEAVFVDC